MLDLKSFHVFLIGAAIVLASGVGFWGVLGDHGLLGVISLALALLLIVYFAYVAARAERV